MTEKGRTCINVEPVTQFGEFPKFWTHGYCTDIFHGVVFWLRDMLERRWSSPGDFTEILREPINFGLFLDECFDFHCRGASRALQRFYLKYSFHIGSPISTPLT